MGLRPCGGAPPTLWTGDLPGQVMSQQQRAGGKRGWMGQGGAHLCHQILNPQTKVLRPEASLTRGPPHSPGRDVLLLPGRASCAHVALRDWGGTSVSTGRGSPDPAPDTAPPCKSLQGHQWGCPHPELRPGPEVSQSHLVFIGGADGLGDSGVVSPVISMCGRPNRVNGKGQPSLSPVRWLRGPEKDTLRMTLCAKPTWPFCRVCTKLWEGWAPTPQVCSILALGPGDAPTRPPDCCSVHSGDSTLLSRGGPWKLRGATPSPLPLHGRVGSGTPSDSSETHFRSGVDSTLTTTAPPTRTHMHPFPWKRSSGKFSLGQEGEP